MDASIREQLVASARTYYWDDIQLYIAEIGWEDWMNAFMEAAEDEMITEWESRTINEVLVDAFETAHGRRFSPSERRSTICS